MHFGDLREAEWQSEPQLTLEDDMGQILLNHQMGVLGGLGEWTVKKNMAKFEAFSLK